LKFNRMVVIHIKRGDSDGFLYETTCATGNDSLIRELVEIWNMRLRLMQLSCSIRDLAKHGPMKKPDKVGLDEIEEQYSGMTIDKSPDYTADPTGLRTGNGVGTQLSDTIERVAMDAEAVLDKNNVDRKVAVTLRILQEKLDNIRGAVTMAYPMGLPEWDSVRLGIEGTGGIEGTAAGQEILNADTAELWVASRDFNRSQTVGDRLGTNEKTKVVGKLQKSGGGPPGREPGVSEDERKAMMAYYFKKQEELKQLAENSEDDYLNSKWADTKGLQRSLRGQDSVRAPGIRR
jgi:cilia- and flagella-associated protein 298